MSIVKTLPYMGGKQKSTLNKWIRSKIPEHYSQIYIEPFAGMLGILLNRPKVHIEIVNDLDENIVAFWQALRDHPEEFLHLIAHTPFSRLEYEKAIDAVAYSEKKMTLLERALATYIIITQGLGSKIQGSYRGFRGRIKSMAASPKTDGYYDRLKRLLDRIDRLVIENVDALELIEYYKDCKPVVMYLDRPYPGTRNYQYDVINLPEIKKALAKYKGFVAISGFNDDYSELVEHGFKEYKLLRQAAAQYKSSLLPTERVEKLWVNKPIDQ